MSPAPRTLALCADDFGLAPNISAGIARLARAKRITMVSCVTSSPHWAADARLLQDMPPDIDMGLHLAFTEGRPLSARLSRRWPRFPALPTLVAMAHLGLLPRPKMRNEVHAQLAAFNQVLGKPPRFIDGRRHVHHLPGLRDIILDMIEHVQPLPAVRSTARVLGPGFAMRRFLIEQTGGRALANELRQRVLPHNLALLGVYDDATTDYRSLMQAWLASVPPEGALLVCHPGEAPSGPDRDPLSAARLRELDYLASPAFDADLSAAGVVLGRVWATEGAIAVTS